MTIGNLVTLMRDGIFQVLIMIAPVLGVALVVGLIIAIFQAITSIQEQTLTFVPKIICVFVALMIFGHWMLNSMTEYMVELWSNFSLYIR